MYSGTSKPNSVNEYFSDFLEEFKQLKVNGIMHNDKSFSIYMKALVLFCLAWLIETIIRMVYLHLLTRVYHV